MEASQINQGDLITVRELVDRLKLAEGTIYNQIGRLGTEERCRSAR